MLKYKCPKCGELVDNLSGSIFDRYFYCSHCRIISYDTNEIEKVEVE